MNRISQVITFGILSILLMVSEVSFAQHESSVDKEIRGILAKVDSLTTINEAVQDLVAKVNLGNDIKISVLDSLKNIGYLRQDINIYGAILLAGDSLCSVELKRSLSPETRDYMISKSVEYKCFVGLYYFQKTDYEKAIRFLDKSLAENDKLKTKDKKTKAICYNVKAIIKCEQGRYDEGIRFFFASKKIFEELDDQNQAANTLMNIALTYRTLGEYDKAIFECKNAIKILKKTKGKGQTLGKLHNNLGGIYTDKGDYKQAGEHLAIALKIQKNGFDSIAIAGVYSNYGNMYTKLGDVQKQLYNYKKAYSIYSNLGIQLGKAEVGVKLASALYKLNPDDPEAFRLASESMEIAEQNRIADVIQASAEFLQNYYSRKKQYEKAYEYLNLSVTYMDSILSDQNRNELFRQQNKYAYEKKKEIDDIKHANNIEREQKKQQTLYIIVAFSVIVIALFWIGFRRKQKANHKLTELNEKLNASEQSLKVLNASKDKFFAIISHDLRNPLAAFKNTAKVLIQADDQVSPDKMKEHFLDIKESADQMSDLTEKLLAWSRSQAGLNEPNKIGVDLGIVAFKAMLFAQHQAKEKNIEVTSLITENSLVLVDLDMIATVFRNILSNALKFTQENGTVEINARELDNFIEVAIRDNGIGIAQEDIKKLFRIESDHKSIGNSANKGSGLGLILCKEFIERNGGQIWVESELGKGTAFFFTLQKI